MHSLGLVCLHQIPVQLSLASKMAARKIAAKIDEASSTPLPPPRKEKKGLRHDVDKPLKNTSLGTEIYWIAGLIALYLVYVTFQESFTARFGL